MNIDTFPALGMFYMLFIANLYLVFHLLFRWNKILSIVLCVSYPSITVLCCIDSWYLLALKFLWACVVFEVLLMAVLIGDLPRCDKDEI
jgi:hypothetical protein